jgi:hypothetical protein
VNCRHGGSFSRKRSRDPFSFYIRVERNQIASEMGAQNRLCMRTGVSWVTRPFVGTIEAVINSHLPRVRERHIPTLGHRVADGALDSSYTEPLITSAQVETQHFGSEVSHLPETELCLNLRCWASPRKGWRSGASFKLGGSSKVREPQTVFFNYGRPTRDPNPQLSPPPPFGKENGIKERSDGQGISRSPRK